MTYGAFMVLYEGNGALLNFYSQVKNPKTFMGQVNIVLFLLTGLSMLVGILSYLAFQEDIGSLIIYNLPNNGLGISVQFLYLFAIAGVYLMSIQPVFSVIESYDSYQNWGINEYAKRLIMRSSAVFVSAISSWIFPDMNTLLSIAGCIMGTCLSIAYPTFLYNNAYKDSPKKKKMRMFNWCYLGFGIIIGTIGLIDSVMFLFDA